MSQQPAYAAVIQENSALKSERDALKRQLGWFQKQMFGEKSERRLVEANPQQLVLESLLGEPVATEPVASETITYQRSKAKKKRPDDCVHDTGLRFNDNVPVQIIAVPAPG